MLLCGLKAIVIWVGLTFLGINFIGFIVRPLFIRGSVKDGDSRVRGIIEKEMQRTAIGGIVFSLLVMGVTAAAFWYLFSKNPGLCLVLLLSMLAQVPELAHGIKTGIPISKENRPSGFWDNGALSLRIALLPLTWYYVCR